MDPAAGGEAARAQFAGTPGTYTKSKHPGRIPEYLTGPALHRSGIEVWIEDLDLGDSLDGQLVTAGSTPDRLG
jgi:hypothetical protein